MVTGKMFRMALDKFFKSPVAQEARVQICMPDGQMYDIKDIKFCTCAGTVANGRVGSGFRQRNGCLSVS